MYREMANRSADTIIDIQVIAHDVPHLQLPAKLHSCMAPDYLLAIPRLPIWFQFGIQNLQVLRFGTRPKTTVERHQSLTFTPQAAAVLDILREKVKPNELKHETLLGFRCNACLHHQFYVPGSTSFIGISEEPTKEGVWNAVKNHLNHFQHCPGLSDVIKTALSLNFIEAPTPAERQFCGAWTACLITAYFRRAPKARKPRSLNKTACPQAMSSEDRPVEPPVSTLSSPPRSNDDLFGHLSESFQVASKLINEPVLIFDDMAEEMDRCMMPALFMELFSESFQLCVTRSHTDNDQKVTMCCSMCLDSPKLSLPSLLLPEPLPHGLEVVLCDFVVGHASNCPTRSVRWREFFHQQAQNVSPEFWRTFAKWWQVYLKILFRSCATLPVDRQVARAETTLWDSCQPWKCVIDVVGKSSATSPPLAPSCALESDVATLVVSTKSIIVDNELHRDGEANRWYRNEISRRRSLYVRSSIVEQEEIVRQFLEFVKDLGYDFKSIGDDGEGYPTPCERVREFVAKSLMDGFPDLLRTAYAPSGRWRVIDMEIAPRDSVADGSKLL